MKYIAFLLTVVFVIVGLTGCGGNKETPTDAAGFPTPSQTDSFISAPASEESKAAVQETAVSSQAPTEGNTSAQPKQATGSKTPGVTSSAVAQENKQPVSSKADQQTQGDIAVFLPEFKSEAALNDWLLGKSDAFSEERSQMLSTHADGSSIFYYKPAELLKETEYKVKSIEVEKGTITYIFDEVDSTDYQDFVWVVVWKEDTQYRRNTYEEHKQKWLDQDDRYYVTNINGIEYVCFRNAFDKTVVNWIQFDRYFTAYFAPGYFEQIDQVLPLLKLEKVTLRTDTVNE